VSGIDVASVVPSTRDLLQAIATRRKCLAVVPKVDVGSAGEAAARLDAIGVRAFAVVDIDAVPAVAAATRSVPVLSLAPVGDRDAVLLARSHGADGVCLDAGAPAELAGVARSTHMLAVAIASGADELAAAARAGARAVLLRAATVDEAIAAAASAPRPVAVLAQVPAASLDQLRALAGHVDAVLVGSELHDDAAFTAFVAAVDP
jgi:indole-3-glycerol phosphate synthase